MDKIWRWGMILFLLCGLLLGNEEDMMTAMMDTPYMVLDLVVTLILSACLWGGFLNIIEKTGFMNYFAFLLKPILHLIYGDILEQESVYDYISSNVTANLLGLGTLATLSGIKAFKRLHELNSHPHYPSREMLTLVIMNTAGMCLFPSSLIMLRQQFGSSDVYAFYPYMIFISLTIIIVGLMIQRVIDHE